MRISDWSSDVCSSDLIVAAGLFDDLEDPTKKGDFIAWSDHVIGARAAGGAAEYVRGYLKAICQKGWQLATGLLMLSTLRGPTPPCAFPRRHTQSTSCSRSPSNRRTRAPRSMGAAARS